MTHYIKDQQTAHDPWTLIRPDNSEEPAHINIPDGQTIIPFTVWQAQPALHTRTDLGIWLENTLEPEHINIDWNRFPVIALDYPKFTDGRSHTLAYLLRNRLGYQNELRAIGDVLVDQIYNMKRVGINAYTLRTDQKTDTALRMLNAFSQTYQGSTDDARPLYQRNTTTQPVQHDSGLSAKIQQLESQLTHISTKYAPATLANSLAYEDMVLTDIIARLQLPIRQFTLQTGMLHPETTHMIAVIAQHYNIEVVPYSPDEQDIEQYTEQHGKHAFYESIELRKTCCHLRKVKPLQKALQGHKAWITGQRAEQSITRVSIAAQEHDSQNQLEKFNPLRDWTFADIKAYIQKYKVPYNPLHDQGYPSIGCEPCTRAIKPNEDQRAGRWWWEHTDSKECGLHQSPTTQHTQHTQHIQEDNHD